MSALDSAVGKWPSLLASFGLSEGALSGRHCPCPVCGGKDRFRFTNLEGRGTSFCSHCGPTDGIGLVQRITGANFKSALKDIESRLGMATVTTIKRAESDDAKRARLMRVWNESAPACVGGPVIAYLRRRLGLAVAPRAVREHPSLRFDGGYSFPAMVAKVVRGGRTVSLHRTYLTDDGRKAPVENAKKLMPGFGVSGASIPLAPAAERMGVAEGIETALAASLLFDLPVWAAISASGMESWEPPPTANDITIFADNDANGVGQCAAYTLMKRLHSGGAAVRVLMPSDVGQDYADVIGA